MREAYGVPVVDSAKDLPRVVEALGIVPWKRARPLSVDLDEYRETLSEERWLAWNLVEGIRKTTSEEIQARRAELAKFAPKAEVLFLVPPGGDKTGICFRSVGRNWVMVFATMPDPDLASNFLVPIVAEWKHGAEVTVIGPVCGMLENGESPRDCALREFKEETGFELADAVQLAPEGLAVSPRQSTQQYFPFLGTVKEPITRDEVKLDKTEHLKLLFVRLSAWVDFVLSGVARGDDAYATTFLALHKMGLLRIDYSTASGRGIRETI